MIYMEFNEGTLDMILSQFHCVVYTNHPRVKKMYVDLKSLFLWVGMKKGVETYVSWFLECKKVKAKH